MIVSRVHWMNVGIWRLTVPFNYSDAFLAENSAREGVVVTETGLQYEIQEEGDGPKAARYLWYTFGGDSVVHSRVLAFQGFFGAFSPANMLLMKL